MRSYKKVGPRDLTIVIEKDSPSQIHIYFGNNSLGGINKLYFRDDRRIDLFPELQLGLHSFNQRLDYLSRKFDKDTLTIVVEAFVERHIAEFENVMVFLGDKRLNFITKVELICNAKINEASVILDLFNLINLPISSPSLVRQVKVNDKDIKKLNKQKELLSKIPWIMSSNDIVIKSIL